MERVYLVETVDEWNNHTFVGFFTDLKEATKEVKKIHCDYKGIEELELKEYASTFGWQFNTELEYNEDTGEWLSIFGYILGYDDLMEELRGLGK